MDDDIDGGGDAKPSSADKAEYKWEKAYQRSWEILEEDETGALRSIAKTEERAKKRSRATTEVRAVRRGMIRYIYVVLDLSRAVDEKDLKPSRLSLATNLLQLFVKEFFDQNPISQMGIIVTRNGMAEKLQELSANPRQHIAALKGALSTGGDPSLQNALDMARLSLSSIPSYGNREVIVIYSAMSTCDPGDIYATVDSLRRDNVRCSVVGLCAELRICRYLSEKTGGTYGVALNEDHLRELIVAHAAPPPTSVMLKPEPSLIRMGFPQRLSDTASLCVCHRELQIGGYLCPRCKSKVCELPSDCPICGLTLASSPHVARSYHHLFPVPPYTELTTKSDDTCLGCLKYLPSTTSLRLQCPTCKSVFCLDCDAYVHDVLHNCPGCEVSQANLS